MNMFECIMNTRFGLECGYKMHTWWKINIGRGAERQDEGIRYEVRSSGM